MSETRSSPGRRAQGKPARRLTAAVAVVAALLAVTIARIAPAEAAELREVTNFGSNPGNVRMFIYVPDRVANPAPLVVAMHGCGGTASFQLSTSRMQPLADQYGFIMVLPQGPGCWADGTSTTSIKSMIDYTKATYDVDDSRVFATGISAGGFLTSVMAGRFPGVFAAASEWSGAPFGCNLYICAIGLTQQTPQQWGNAVRTANPGYSGPWPRMQIWHGTQDTIVQSMNAQETMEQWTDVHGADQTADATRTLPNNVTQRDYTDASGRVVVEWFSWPAGHTVNPSAAAQAIRFFGLDGGGGGTTSSSTPGSSSSTSTTGAGQCVTAANSAHVQAGRATSWLVFAWANGSDDYLGLTFATTSLRQTAPNTWTMVPNC
jgi:poly(hydroxyalkanoate) depolymerase family esterase